MAGHSGLSLNCELIAEHNRSSFGAVARSAHSRSGLLGTNRIKLAQTDGPSKASKARNRRILQDGRRLS